MATKKLLKSTQNKLKAAAAALNEFSTGAVINGDIILNDLYKVSAPGGPITFTLRYNNTGMAASTDVLLDDKVLKTKVRDSITDFPVGTKVAGKFLKIFSAFSATSLTPVPDKLKVDFIISGGKETVTYTLPDFKLTTTGDQGNINISIFFLNV